MTRPARTVSVGLPAPVGGLNFRDPLSLMPPTDSPWMYNVECDARRVKIKDGFQVHCATTYPILTLGAVNPYSSSGKLYAMTRDVGTGNKFYEVTSGTESLSTTCSDDKGTEYSIHHHAGRTYFAADNAASDCSLYTDGTTDTLWNWDDGSTLITTQIMVNYKSRAYLFSGTSLYYSPVGAVTGSCTEVSLANVFRHSGDILWAKVISSPRRVASEVYLAIGNNAGEILVYGGDYPGSSSWGLIAQFHIAAPMHVNAAFEFQNDVWVFTYGGIISLRRLFELGDQAGEALSVSSKIDPYWTHVMKFFGAGKKVRAQYWPERNKVYLLLPAFINGSSNTWAEIQANSSAGLLSYDVTTEAWSILDLECTTSGGVTDICYYNNNLYYSTGTYIYSFAASSYKDEDYGNPGNYSEYNFEIQGAYQDFGAPWQHKKLSVFTPILKTDFAGSKLGLQASVDFGRKVSGTTKANQLADGYNNLPYHVGNEGCFHQYRVTGTSDADSSDGLELYSISATIEPGGNR